MTGTTEPEPIRQLVEEVNTSHGLRFSLRGRCAHGLQGGAWMLADTAGRLAVLKRKRTGSGPDIQRLAAEITRIRASGYPTPAWIASGSTSAGTSYWVQEYVPGHAATPLTAPTTELLVDVLERQAGLAPVLDRDWSDEVAAMALCDEEGGLRRIVRGVGSAGAALLTRYDRLLGPAPW